MVSKNSRSFEAAGQGGLFFLAGTGQHPGRLHRMGASLWQEAGAPAGWADGQVGTSHLVHAPSMRPTHATARSRAMLVPVSHRTERCMVLLPSLTPAMVPHGMRDASFRLSRPWDRRLQLTVPSWDILS
jgi:hypothetical protein